MITLVLVVLVVFSLADPSAQCEEDLFKVLLNKDDPTNQKILNAWGTIPPPGVLDGNFYALGAPWQCNGLGKEIANSCTLSNTEHKFYLNASSPQGSAAKVIPFKALSLCVPSSCSHDNLLDSLAAVAVSAGFTFQVLPESSVTVTCNQDKKYDNGAIFMITLLSLIAFIGISASIVDEYFEYSQNVKPKLSIDMTAPLLDGKAGKQKEQLPVWLEYVRTFSAIRGARQLITVKPKKIDFENPKPDLTCMNGIRVLSLLWVMLGHTYENGFLAPVANLKQVPELAERFNFQFVVNSIFAVDSFFVLSGYLAIYTLYTMMQRMEGIPVAKIFYMYFHRIMRILPTYLLVVAMYTLLFKYVFSGPLWQVGTDQIESVCKKYWWRNILFIDNLFPFQENCMRWGWYLSNDMQFFLLAPWLALLWSKFPKVGHVTWSLLLLGSILYCIIITVKHKMDVFGFITQVFYPNDPFNNDYRNYLYFKPWSRVQSYLIGMVFGYAQHRFADFIKEFRKHSHKVIISAAFILSMALMCLPLFGLHSEQTGTKATQTEDVFYLSFSGISWSIGLSMLLFLCINGFGSYINDFLSLSVWAPLARMGLPAYLIHFFYVDIHRIGAQTVGYVSDYTILRAWCFIAFLAYISAFVLAIFVENPMRILETQLLTRRK